ncbi:MAG TPA: sulfatase [Planctomicrobium sp.]|nr:sulfatase [Planctomicrobium sp.]
MRSIPKYLILGFCFITVIGSMSLLQGAERNILFVITDDQSPTLGCYGDPVAVTPHADQLAKEGTLFRNAYATVASCSPSRSVVLSGIHNHLNGQYGLAHGFHHFSAFPNTISLALPPALSDTGYRTAQIGKLHVSPEEIFRFETYLKGNPRSAVEMAEACREFINKKDDRPFFLYFALTDPHRSGERDENSKREFKPNLFGNKPDHKAFPEITEVFYEPKKVPVPYFLPDTPECREELAQYYQSCSRIDQGLGRLVSILKDAGLYDKTLIVFTSDHGIAMPGAKTTVYDAGLNVPFVVRNPYEKDRGIESNALISHADITPSLLDFADALDREKNRPKKWVNPEEYWKKRKERLNENRSGGHRFDRYHGQSWIPILGISASAHPESEVVYASHTFHEGHMYYPMRAVRDHKFKLIWNLADGLIFPSASDLWAGSTWQAQYQLGMDAPYGKRTVRSYLRRSRFELFDIKNDPQETTNLADDPRYATILQEYQQKLRNFQQNTQDPWISKWNHE